jgi:putative ABC transport system permease protein
MSDPPKTGPPQHEPSGPDWRSHIRERLSSSLRLSPTRERDIVDELAQHLDDRWRELVSGGASPERATALALAEFHDRDTLARFLAPLRQAQTPPPLAPGAPIGRWPGDLWRDVRYAVRMLRRRPGFAIVATVTIAIAIGANTAMFSVVRAALLAPLPFADADRLVVVWEGYPPGQPRAAVSVPGYLDIREASEVFADAAALGGENANLTGDGEPERLDIARVTHSFQPVLGLHVALGRWFTKEEDAPNRNDVLVLSDGLWRRRFGADPSVVGRSIALNDRSHVIVGIMAASSTYPKDVDAWKPIAFTPQERTPAARGSQDLATFARLRPGLTYEQAHAALRVVAQTLRAAHYADTPRWTLDMRSIRDELVGTARPILLAAFSAVALVLLIACANVANLLLARSGERQRELAVRAAIGATSARLRRQLLVEASALAGSGAIAGVMIAVVALPLLTEMVSQSFPSLAPPRLDANVFLFAAAVTLGCSLAFGLVPAWSLARTDLRVSLADARPASARSGPRALFVVGQVAMAFALLVGGGLLVKSFRTMMAIDPGYSVDRRLTFRVSLPEARYPGRPERAAFWSALFERLPRAPGVRNAAGVSELPLSNWQSMGTFQIEGRNFARADLPHAYWRSVSAGYFATMGVAVVDGRSFSARDGYDSPRVAIIDELARTRYWGTENPIGRRVSIGRDSDRPIWTEIVGVVRTVRHNSLDEEAVRPTLYFPLEQRATDTVFAVVQADGEPLTTLGAVRSAVQDIDPRLPIYDIQTMEARLGDSVGQRRIAMWLIGLFGTVAVILAIVGVYGVVAYEVSRRAREMALRVALGADRRAIVTLVVNAGLRMAVAGIACGTVVALGFSHAARALLFGVSPFDAATYVMLGAVLLLVTAAATYIPARRAAKVDPLVALRAE